jgi:hypothetical protein
VQSLTLSRLRAGPSVSLCQAGGSLYAVYTEWDSGTLIVSEILEGARLPDSAPVPAIVDRVQAGPVLSGNLGLHAAAAFGGEVHVLYLDRRREDKKVLKALTHRSAGLWEVDALEPPGEPVAVVPDSAGTPLAFWSADALLVRSLSSGNGPRGLRAPFAPANPGSPAGSAFTVYDLASRSLVLVSAGSGDFTVSQVPGGQAVHAAAVSPSGRVAVATYAPESRRILLLEQQAGSTWKSTTVTMTEDTRFLYVAERAGSYVFLYDGLAASRGGAPLHALWLLARKGNRYRRALVWEGPGPLTGAAALVSGDAAYVLVASEDVRLLKIDIP